MTSLATAVPNSLTKREVEPGRLEVVTRVIAGAAGGRRLQVPPGNGTRPTSDRAREGLFASVMSEFGDLDGVRVMDLYAGSGALGLEALSRGAASVLLVESDARAAGGLKAHRKGPGPARRAGGRRPGGTAARPSAGRARAPAGRGLRPGVRRPAVRGDRRGRGHDARPVGRRLARRRRARRGGAGHQVGAV